MPEGDQLTASYTPKPAQCGFFHFQPVVTNRLISPLIGPDPQRIGVVLRTISTAPMSGAARKETGWCDPAPLSRVAT